MAFLEALIRLIPGNVLIIKVDFGFALLCFSVGYSTA
jgi:hypothetical protein